MIFFQASSSSSLIVHHKQRRTRIPGGNRDHGELVVVGVGGARRTCLHLHPITSAWNRSGILLCRRRRPPQARFPPRRTACLPPSNVTAGADPLGDTTSVNHDLECTEKRHCDLLLLTHPPPETQVPYHNDEQTYPIPVRSASQLPCHPSPQRPSFASVFSSFKESSSNDPSSIHIRKLINQIPPFFPSFPSRFLHRVFRAGPRCWSRTCKLPPVL